MYNKVQSKALIINALHLNKVKGVICRLSCRLLHTSVFLQCTYGFTYRLQSTRRSTILSYDALILKISRTIVFTNFYDAIGKQTLILRSAVRSFLRTSTMLLGNAAQDSREMTGKHWEERERGMDQQRTSRLDSNSGRCEYN